MFISLGHLSKKMIIPLSIPIFYSLRHYILEKFDENLSDSKKHSVFLNTFILSIGYSFNIFLFLIEKKKIKSNKKKIQEKEFDNQLLIEKKKIEKIQKKNKLLLFVLLPLFNFFNHLSYDILSMFKPNNYNKNFFYTLSVPIFFIVTALMSYQFLNAHIYRHQISSMIISLLLSISLLCILAIKEETKNDGVMYLIVFIVEAIGLRSLRYILIVFGKLFMDKMFVTHIQLQTSIGLFGILYSLIANSLSFLINFNFIENPDLNDYFKINDNGKKRLKTIFDSWGNFRDENWIYFLISVILFFAENYMIWFCVYSFSPNHYTIYGSINSICAIFIEIVVKNIFGNFNDILICIFSSVALCVIFFCGLIFNEIFIIRICKLDKYTNVEINRRQKEETQISLIKYNIDNYNNNNNNELPDNSFDSDYNSEKGRMSTNSVE